MTIEVDAWENGLTKHDEVKELKKEVRKKHNVYVTTVWHCSFL